MSATTERNKAVVTGLVQAINDDRPDLLPTWMADGFVDHNKIMFGEPDEPGAALEAVRTTLTAFAPYRIRVEEMLAEGDRVVVRFVQTGVNSGWHPRTPEPTGRAFENESIFVFTVRDGRITELRGVADRMTMLTQLGVLPDLG